MYARRAPRQSTPDPSDTLIRIAFLVRVVALAVAAVGLVLQGGPWRSVVVFCLLLLTSHLGLQRPGVRRLVAEHPSLALPDIALVALIPVLAGDGSPLALVSLSSALLIGSLFALRTAVPLTVLLIVVQLFAGLEGGELGVEDVATAMTMVSVALIGWLFRRFADERQRLAQESAIARTAAAAAHERLRLARDLHDTVAKTVQGVALSASALPQWMARDPEVARQQAELIADAAGEALVAARALLTSLRLDDPLRPFCEVLGEVADRWRAHHDHVLTHDLAAIPALSPDQRHELVMAMSEALENVARHAPGAAVHIQLSARPGPVACLEIADDGPGFSPAAESVAVRDGRYGLTGIRERLFAIGGSAAIVSVPDHGTAVRLSVPLAPGARAAVPRRSRAKADMTRLVRST